MNSDQNHHGEPQAEPTRRLTAPVDSRPQAVLPFPVVGIGASAGGIHALEAFFKSIEPDSGMAYVVVQHLSPDHTSMLGDILSRAGSIPVKEVEEGDEVRPDHAYVIAPGRTLTLSQGRLKLGEPVSPQVLLSDIGLPGEDGYALIRHVRSLDGSKPPVAIALTAFARQEDPQRALESGFDEHIAKPVDADELIRLIAKSIGR